jgi:hypothetical protein
MMRKIIAILTLGISLQSCGFLFYNYRGYVEVNYSILNCTLDTNLRYSVGQFLFKQSLKSDFYGRFASQTFDTLCFYGPDYHWLKFKITEDVNETKIHFTYFGYNGWRGHPPQKQFISTIRDSLINGFGATETIIQDVSNEKKRKTSPNSAHQKSQTF